MSEKFDFDYYERGKETNKSGYSGYEFDYRIYHYVKNIIDDFKVNSSDRVLDFGCAKGFYVEAFRYYKIEAFGCDISSYALSCAREIYAKPFLSNSMNDFSPFDLVVSLDTLEHISYEEIDDTLSQISKITKNFFCLVPLGKNGKYTNEEYENDITHIIREDHQWWIEKLNKFFNVVDWNHKVDRYKNPYNDIPPESNAYFFCNPHK